MFWLNSALMGGAYGANSPEAWSAVSGWVVATLISITIHELGHAFAMRKFGDPEVSITLYALGGFAAGSRPTTRWEDIQITAAGPGLQIAYGLGVGWAMTLWRIPFPWVHEVCDAFVAVSLFWALLNLVPILPMDGGRLSAAISGSMRLALVISLVCASALALGSLNSQAWLGLQNWILDLAHIPVTTRIVGGAFSLIFFGFMAFNNFKQLKGEHQINGLGNP